MNRVLQGDVLGFARHYRGDPFHTLLCDAPYHLTSIIDRFGEEDSAPAQEGTDGAFNRLSKGFMGKTWDGGDIAFQPETWRAFWHLLYPGAFGMTFGGSRTSHRMAVAIEDAGFIIHPQIAHVFGSGFPKATRIKDNKSFEGYRYGLQAMKPAMEIIIVFQKPYKGRPVDDITRTGAGALNIEGGRIGTELRPVMERTKTIVSANSMSGESTGATSSGEITTQGRWPANFIIQHSPDCVQVGTSPDEYTINRFTDGAKPFGDAIGEEFESEEVGGESIVWQCADGCPARELDRQSGHLQSGIMTPEHNVNSEWGYQGGKRNKPTLQNTFGDSGGASRFFFNADYTYEKLEQTAPFYYQAKASKRERNAGLGNDNEYTIDDGRDTPIDNPYQRGITKRQNPHPTIKPIALIKHLATLLLPPSEYAPRRILVPFAGTGSEMIGAQQAGWDYILGIEKEAEYVDIAKARIGYWQKQGTQLDLFKDKE